MARPAPILINDNSGRKGVKESLVAIGHFSSKINKELLHMNLGYQFFGYFLNKNFQNE